MNSSDQVTSAPQELRWFFSQSPLLGESVGLWSDDTPITIHVMTPISSPMKTGVATTMHDNVVTNNVVDPQEEWLPITESRNGNAFYAACHTISSGIGFQALMLPLAFVSLGWIWGITCLSLGFIWQLYTTWLLIQLHESENGTRYSRYLRLSIAAFGEKLGKLLSLFPIMYLSGGTCVALIMFGSGTIKIFYQTVCGPNCKEANPLTNVECSFQIYAMPVFDNLEFRFTSSKKKSCPRWLRSGIRAFFGCLTVFIAFTVPFLPSLAGLLGGLTLPLALAYPCFMWIKIKKPREFGFMWYLNWGLGCFGILLSILLVTGAIWSIAIKGMPVHFFQAR
uniref:Amino acid transporter transmembrane domain-containing protein n=1 Tax=Chenopodium quinoa TaxID=63459 RepID=A0A803MXH8_CHEQI